MKSMLRIRASHFSKKIYHHGPATTGNVSGFLQAQQCPYSNRMSRGPELFNRVSGRFALTGQAETGQAVSSSSVVTSTSLRRSFASYSAERQYDGNSGEPMQASLPRAADEEPMQPSLPRGTEYSNSDSAATQPKQPSLASLAAQANPDNAASFVLMSNIYADGGKWDDVKRINDMRLKARAWKKPGKAYIEIKAKVHEFIVGDETHENSKNIYEKLRKLKRKMNRTGYVPNVDLILENRSNYDPFKPK